MQFNSNHSSEENLVLEEIPRIVTPELQISLSKFPTMEEHKEVIDNVNPNSAPGLNGFYGFFYHFLGHY